MMSAELLPLVLLGAFVGMFATVFNAIRARELLSSFETTVMIAGGAFGGAAVGLNTDPHEVARSTILLMALAGYFTADVFGALAHGRAK